MMKLINKKTRKVISKNIVKSGWQGLMFKKRLPANEAVLLEISRESRALASVHMFFVFQKIDVVWLDNEFRVVDIAKELKPFAPFKMPKQKAKYIVEFRAGTAKAKGIKAGSVLQLVR